MALPVIDPSAKISEGVSLGHNVVIEAEVEIGANTTIGHGCVIHAGTIVGESVTVFDNAVLGRIPRRVASMTRTPTKDLPPLRIGNHCVVGACSVLYRGTAIGEDTLIGDIASIREECEIGTGVIIARCVTVNYKTRIGNRVKIMDNTHITGNMVVEDDVFISVLVSTTNDDTMDQGSSDSFQGPWIKKGARIGASAVLLPGTVIGEHAVVGAGAVVTREVPARTVVSGSPAQVLKDVPVEWLTSVPGWKGKRRK